MGTSQDQLNESVEQLLGRSIVRNLHENLGVGKQAQSKSRKRGEKNYTWSGNFVVAIRQRQRKSSTATWTIRLPLENQ